MNFEHDEPERLAWTWDGEAKLSATRAQWIDGMYRDFATGKFDRIAKVMRTAHSAARPEMRSIPAPRFVVSPPPPPHDPVMYDVISGHWRRQGSRLEPWSARSAAEFGAPFTQPGDPDFQPCTGWQAYLHNEALSRKRA